ncbi:arginine metabolism regulation protein II [Elasticomyces elasticus]|nr:arginine metabolism regulation protein II [Elasticomyces elasticus]
MGRISDLDSEGETGRCRCPLHSYPSPFVTFSSYEEIDASSARSEQTTPLEESTGPLGCPENEPSETTTPTTYIVPSPQPTECSDYAGHGTPTISLPAALSMSMIRDGSREDNELFHHYISNVSVMMTPIDDDHNPWKSTYPCLAVHDVTSASSRSLAHGILAQSAFHLSNLDLPNHASYRRSAMRHFGIALRQLRRGLAGQTENFSCTLAAMLTITLAEHVFHGQSKGLSHHLQGSVQYVARYLGQKPWATSYEAWVITQSFVLHTLMSQIVGDTVTDTASTATTLHDVLEDVTTDPRFAYTLGSTPRLMKALYQARLLEEQLAARESFWDAKPNLSEDELLQASKILAALNTPLDAEVELYMSRQRPMETPAQQRKFIVSNLTLFNSAVAIYLLRVVLRYPPSVVAEQVSQTLSAALALLEMNRVAVSIWPIFIAAAEAYTDEAQALAERVLSLSTSLGATNRAVIHRVVKQIWSERQATAAQRRCEGGDVLVDWRQVLKNMDVEILLL